MSDTPYHYQTITEIAARIRSGELTSVSLTQTLLDRISATDANLKSYVTVTADLAMQAAERADSELSEGRDRGPLHGIPIALKDLYFTKGIPTMGGSQALADHTPDFDGTAVARLSEAGAVLLGKLNLTEGAMGGYNPEFQVPVNPWKSDHWAGASSSGSGVATAAGQCFASLGSDTGGSIRFPAAACGTVGLKPTWGRVSRYGVLPLAESLDHVGPLTRSVEDAAIVLDAMAGHDPNDPTSLPDLVSDAREKLGEPMAGIRIGYAERYATDGVDPEMAASVREAIRILEGLGAQVIDVSLPNIDPYVSAWKTLCSSEAVAAHRSTYPSRRDDYGPWFRDWLDTGAAVNAAEYAEAHYLRLACNGHFRSAFQEIDILACPSMTAPAHPVTREVLYGRFPTDRQPKFQRFTAPFDYNGAPTLSIPSRMSSDGLPLSLQLIGKPLSEPLLCQVGHAYERETEWQNHHPKV